MNLGFYHTILLAGLLDHFKPELVRHHGKILYLPFLIFGIIVFRVSKRHQMAKSPSDHIIFPFDYSIVVLIAVKDPGNIPGHRRFFRYN